jgi:hypothetical protein
MEAVAAYAVLGHRPRDCVKLRKAWPGSMEGVVEAGNLRQLRELVCDRADRREVVRQVQGKERDQLFDIGDDIVIELYGRDVRLAAEDDPVAGGEHPHTAGVAFDPVDDVADRIGVAQR